MKQRGERTERTQSGGNKVKKKAEAKTRRRKEMGRSNEGAGEEVNTGPFTCNIVFLLCGFTALTFNTSTTTEII